MSLADVRRVRGQVEQLLVAIRTRSRPAGPSCGRRPGGCRRGCGRAATQLGERPSQRGALADAAPSGAGTRRRSPAAPGGSRRAVTRLRPSDDLHRAGEERLGRVGIARTAEGTNSSTSEAARRRRCRTRVRVNSAWPGAPSDPADDDRASRGLTPAGTSTSDALDPAAPGSAGRTCRRRRCAVR